MDGEKTMRYAMIGVGLAVLWVAYLALFGPSTAGPSGLTAPDLARANGRAPADFGWTLRDLDDKPVDFARFRGRPILLNLWATWCPPCRAEMPALASLADDPRIKAKDVAVICVSEEPAATVRSYLAGRKWGMTMLRADAIPPIFATDGIPATFLIDPAGRVVASEVGAARWDDPSVVDFLEKLATPGR